MAIFNISELDKKELKQERATIESLKERMQEGPVGEGAPVQGSWRDHFFSSLTARLFFLLLLVADLLWAVYSLAFFAITAILSLILFKTPHIKELRARRWHTLKRTQVCGISLFIALFSPSFGVMIACTYFLMYDKSGIEEVIPASLQSQFQEFFKSS